MERENVIRELIDNPLKELGIRVDDVCYCKEGSMNILRITIDKEPYIDVDDCVEATRVINPIIDKENIITDSYILDVCSKEKGGDK